MDLVGPLSSSRGYTHLLRIVDRFSRWPEAIPFTQTDTGTCAQAVLSNWISRFGIPKHITSDSGPQFTSQLWTSLAELYDSKLHYTTAYHPQDNDLVEQFLRHLKSALRARLRTSSWADELPWILLGIRTHRRMIYRIPRQNWSMGLL